MNPVDIRLTSLGDAGAKALGVGDSQNSAKIQQ